MTPRGGALALLSAVVALVAAVAGSAPAVGSPARIADVSLRQTDVGDRPADRDRIVAHVRLHLAVPPGDVALAATCVEVWNAAGTRLLVRDRQRHVHALPPERVPRVEQRLVLDDPAAARLRPGDVVQVRLGYRVNLPAAGLQPRPACPSSLSAAGERRRPAGTATLTEVGPGRFRAVATRTVRITGARPAGTGGGPRAQQLDPGYSIEYTDAANSAWFGWANTDDPDTATSAGIESLLWTSTAVALEPAFYVGDGVFRFTAAQPGDAQAFTWSAPPPGLWANSCPFGMSAVGGGATGGDPNGSLSAYMFDPDSPGAPGAVQIFFRTGPCLGEVSLEAYSD